MKKTYFASALMLALTSGTLFAQTLVTVNGQAIDSSVIDDQVASVRASNPNVQDTPELRQMLTERQVISTVVTQEAKKLKLDQSAEFKAALEQARADAAKQGADKKATFKTEWAVFENDLLGQAFAAHIVRQYPVQEKDVKAAYNDFSNFYKGTQEVQLGEIVTDSSSNAQKAIADLDAKKSFVSVLNQYSIDEASKKPAVSLKLMFRLKICKNQRLRFTQLSKTWKKVRTLKRRCKTVICTPFSTSMTAVTLPYLLTKPLKTRLAATYRQPVLMRPFNHY